MFVTKWNFIEGEQSLFDDKEIVETAGYVPRQKTIENLLLCGQRLIESRMEEYDGATVEEALENEKVEFLINMINDMDIKDKLRLAICMSKSEWTGLIYNTKENYKKFDSLLKSIDYSIF